MINGIDAGVQVSKLRQEEKAGAALLRLVETLGIGTTNNFNNYITITNFSSQSSDSEGTLAYKRMRRDLEYEKKIESIKRQDAERKQQACEKELFRLKQQIS